MMRNESGSLVWGPKFMVPRQRRLTLRAVRPRRVYFMPLRVHIPPRSLQPEAWRARCARRNLSALANSAAIGLEIRLAPPASEHAHHPHGRAVLADIKGGEQSDGPTERSVV